MCNPLDAQAEHGVAGPHPLAAYYLVPLASPHAGADDLEVSQAVESWHLRSLAADEGDAETPAGLGRAADYPGDGLGIETSAPDVVEEQ